jgi:hypothetical protein
MLKFCSPIFFPLEALKIWSSEWSESASRCSSSLSPNELWTGTGVVLLLLSRRKRKINE